MNEADRQHLITQAKDKARLAPACGYEFYLDAIDAYIRAGAVGSARETLATARADEKGAELFADRLDALEARLPPITDEPVTATRSAGRKVPR